MMLFLNLLWLFFLQAVCSEAFSDHAGRAVDLNSTSMPGPVLLPFEIRRKERRERVRAKMQLRQAQNNNKPATHVAVPKESKKEDDSAMKTLTEWLRGKVTDPDYMIIATDRDTGNVDGWGALLLKEGAFKEIEENPAFSRVYEEEKPYRRLSIPRPRQLEHGHLGTTAGMLSRMTMSKRAVQWFRQVEASNTLRAVSLPEGETLDEDNPQWDYVYESHAGEGKYIYIIEEGIQTGIFAGSEFPNPLHVATTHSRDRMDEPLDRDEVDNSHGTEVASIACSQAFGVAKSATLVSVKFHGELVDMARAFERVVAHVNHPDRLRNSVIVSAIGGANPTDPVGILDDDVAAKEVHKSIQELLRLGVPVVTPAGDDNDENNSRPNIDFWPSYWEHDNYPLITVGETEHDGSRTDRSQGAGQATTWAPTSGAEVWLKDEEINDEAGGTSLVGGLIATWMASTEQPKWDDSLEGLARVQAIRRFVKEGQGSGWQRQVPDGQRVVWNGATQQDHAGARLEGIEESELNCYDLETRQFGRRDSFEPLIDEMCKAGTGLEPSPVNDVDDYELEYYKEEMRWVKLRVRKPLGKTIRYDFDACKKAMTRILNECDNDPDNKMGWKAGGEVRVGHVIWSIEPQKLRNPWTSEPHGGCKLFGTWSIEIWGQGWSGHHLHDKIRPKWGRNAEWHLNYENAVDHREWSYRAVNNGITQDGSEFHERIEKDWLEKLIRDTVAYNGMGFSCEELTDKDDPTYPNFGG
ncbi:peptidase S8/S53 domain-containing protein [Massariosphaeria phaeospora]|uniref:Peptidase S8/S53 domain-containing protein n=1 Tax=Massariosphaeria phaeospora TaxID=100035 RepID=A0A7C8M9N5_9PLEO|nr:peptidase S8/S53 domain-containing protein [Massariosphaeria phaeospora]